jgi:hypothetical protein
VWRTEQFHPENRFSRCWDITWYIRSLKLRPRTCGLRYLDASHESTWNCPHNRGQYYYDLSECITTRAVQKLRNANRPWVIHLSGLLTECPRPLPYLIGNIRFGLNLLNQPLSPTRWEDIRPYGRPLFYQTDVVTCLHPCDGNIPAGDNIRPIEQLPEVKDEYRLIWWEKAAD